MKRVVDLIRKGGLTTLAGLALSVTTLAANRGCWMYLYQDELPKEAKKLRKF